MTSGSDSLASLLGDGRTTSEPGSLAALVGEGHAVAGVEAAVALAGLRRRMFAAADPEPIHVGRYRVIGPIGRGGMGVVYRAHDPALGRDVALKLLRGDHGGHERRLRREARAMARLSHPNVVTVLEVGWHEDEGFVVMELVEGRDAAAWLAARERSWREVLEVFLAAGRGLAAAHAVGLVHRDFKPSNVLVGDDGRVRVTDFGLAAMEQTTRDSERHGSDETTDPHHDASTTATGARVGTPRYMAPEQRLGGRVDHRADQWAFAVSLWEALYGEHPFADAEGRIALARPLPARPRPRSSSGRRVPPAIGRALGRALSPLPERRHASIEVLLARLTAAAGRGRRAALGLAVAGVLVVGGVGLASAPKPVPRCEPEAVFGDTWTAEHRAALARAFSTTAVPGAAQAWASVETHVDDWAQRWGRAYRSACETAAEDPGAPEASAPVSCLQGDLAEVRALLGLLEAPDAELVGRADRATRELPAPERCAKTWSRLAGIDPATLVAHEQRMAEVRALGRAGRYADARQRVAEVLEVTPDVPLLQADVQLSLGLNDARLGDLEAGIAAVRAAYYAAATAENADLTARAGLSMVMLESRRADHERAEEWIRHVTPWIERVHEPERRADLHQEVLVMTGELRYDQGRYDEALEALERARGLLDEETSLNAPRLLNQLGLVQLERGEHEAAAELFLRAAELERRRAGANQGQVAVAISNLGNAHMARGDHEAAERAYEEAHALLRASLGPEHPLTANTILNLGNVADLRGDRSRAAALFEQVVAVRTAALGPEHPDTAMAMGNLATVLGKLGQPERGIAMHRDAVAIYEAALGPDHPHTTDARTRLAAALAERERLPEALALLEQALAATEAAHGREHARFGAALRELAVVLRRMGDEAGAELRNRQALAVQERALGPEHPELAIVLCALAEGAVQARRFEEAAALAERARAVGPTSPATRGKAGYLLARALWGLGAQIAHVPQILDEAEQELVMAGSDASHVLEDLRRFRAEVLPSGP